MSKYKVSTRGILVEKTHSGINNAIASYLTGSREVLFELSNANKTNDEPRISLAQVLSCLRHKNVYIETLKYKNISSNEAKVLKTRRCMKCGTKFTTDENYYLCYACKFFADEY